MIPLKVPVIPSLVALPNLITLTRPLYFCKIRKIFDADTSGRHTDCGRVTHSGCHLSYLYLVEKCTIILSAPWRSFDVLSYIKVTSILTPRDQDVDPGKLKELFRMTFVRKCTLIFSVNNVTAMLG